MLTLILKYKWFDLIISGQKNIEYRRRCDYYKRKIENKTITHVRLRRGYTKTEMIKRVAKIEIGECPYNGFHGDYYKIYLEENNEE